MPTRTTPLRRSLLLAPLAWAPFGGTVPARAQLALPPALSQHAGRLLATLIRAGRESAIATGVKTVPPRIHTRLLGFFPDAILRKARYASGQADRIDLPGLAMTYGDIAAITLGEVILFRDGHDAAENAALWAHELTHVMQYERWGIDDFAARYARDSEAVEREARGNAERFATWRQKVRT